MKYKLALLFLLPVLTLIQCISNHSEEENKKNSYFVSRNPEAVGVSSIRLARLDTFLKQAVEKGDLPNAATFIVRKGKVIHHKAFGYRNIENKIPLEVTDIFRIASQSKCITSAALMTLYEEGKFLLDDPVSLYIPAFKNTPVLEAFNPADTSYTTRTAKSEITIRQLLNHTAGFPYDHPIYIKNGIPMLGSLEDVSIEEVVTRLAALPLVHDPGEAFTYGLHNDIIGRLIEVISGIPLDSFLTKCIFKPLGMKDTYFYLPDEKKERLVTLYELPSTGNSLILSANQTDQYFPVAGSKRYFSGGAGLVGTVEDYGRFCQMLLNGGEFMGHRILGRKTIETMTSNQIGEKEVWDHRTQFGFGFEIATDKSSALLPGSEGSFKWGGKFLTDFIIDPKEELVCILYTNCSPSTFREITSYYRTLVYQAIEE